MIARDTDGLNQPAVPAPSSNDRPVPDYLRLPSTFQEAKVRLDRVGMDIIAIEANLGDRNRKDHAGNRLPQHDYFDWRQRTKHALVRKLQERLMLVRWLEERQESVRSGRLRAFLHGSPNDPLVLLAGVYGVLRAMSRENRTRLTDEEVLVIDRVREVLIPLDAEAAPRSLDIVDKTEVEK